VQPLLKTKYAVLMHNDAYPLERDFACEMYRALEANPHYPIAAPQIYETAAEGVIVPHGHHQNLHARPSASGQGLRIDYDLSLHLLTQRKPEDFSEGPQVDFLEDHAFFARSDRLSGRLGCGQEGPATSVHLVTVSDKSFISEAVGVFILSIHSTQGH
ncbi:unnamed protein product, partial [Prorocentrum cordatum]